MRFPFLIYLFFIAHSFIQAQSLSNHTDNSANNSSVSNFLILKQLYGNSKGWGREAMATYTRNSSDATGVCVIPKKLNFMVTAVKEFAINKNNYILAFTSAPLLIASECQTPAGVIFLKQDGKVYKKIDAKPYFFNAGSFGQGGVYSIVPITNSSYAGIAFSELEDDGINTTTMTIVGVLDNQLVNFTPEPIVIAENNYTSKQKPHYFWNATYVFKEGNGEVYDLYVNINGTKVEDGNVTPYTKSIIYKYIDNEYQIFGK